jgi:hypothetical protein
MYKQKDTILLDYFPQEYRENLEELFAKLPKFAKNTPNLTKNRKK